MQTIPLGLLGRGFVKLNLLLLPVSLPLLGFLGIMGGGGPDAPGMVQSFGIPAALIFLGPGALVLAHLAGAKAFDCLFRLVPPGAAAISWPGVIVSALAIIVAGNIFVDDLYQWRKGQYGLSVIALVLDMAGMLAIVLAGGGRPPALGDMLPRRE